MFMATLMVTTISCNLLVCTNNNAHADDASKNVSLWVAMPLNDRSILYRHFVARKLVCGMFPMFLQDMRSDLHIFREYLVVDDGQFKKRFFTKELSALRWKLLPHRAHGNCKGRFFCVCTLSKVLKHHNLWQSTGFRQASSSFLLGFAVMPETHGEYHSK